MSYPATSPVTATWEEIQRARPTGDFSIVQNDREVFGYVERILPDLNRQELSVHLEKGWIIPKDGSPASPATIDVIKIPLDTLFSLEHAPGKGLVFSSLTADGASISIAIHHRSSIQE